LPERKETQSKKNEEASFKDFGNFDVYDELLGMLDIPDFKLGLYFGAETSTSTSTTSTIIAPVFNKCVL
jgi:hypothetical protein